MSDLLFSKNDNNADNQEDVWDDTALIKAYNKSVSLINKKLNVKATTGNQKNQMEVEKMDEEEEEEKEEEEEDEEYDEYDSEDASLKKRENNAWKIGDICMAIYKEDGLLYKAEIINIFDSKCLIKYLYYLNEEEKSLDELYEVYEEENEQSIQKNQPKSSEIQNKLPFKSLLIPPPPPPPGLFDPNSPENDQNDELYTMLMSWYMSGYHTGYYFGLKQAKTKNQIKK